MGESRYVLHTAADPDVFAAEIDTVIDVAGEAGVSGCCEHVVVCCTAQVEIGDVNGVVAGFGEDARELVLEGLVDQELHAEAGSGSTA